jgi:DNA processing protein
VDTLELALCIGRAPGMTAPRLLGALEQLTGEPAATSSAALQASTPAESAPVAPDAWERTAAALASLPGLSGARLRSLNLPAAAAAAIAAPNLARLAADRAWVEREHIRVLGAWSAHYPPQLSRLADGPAVLYVRGDPAVLAAPQLAIVGSRSPTPGGRGTAREFAACLARAGLTITSGLALGIDAASHEGALQAQGRTVAVLGSGLDQVYPREHAALAARIGERGAMLSEFPPGTPPLRPNFPRRNRLISGLSLGTLVVEATRYSGSLLTARLAGEQGRGVFAIPGSIHNPLAAGCHALIKSGAKLVECAQDVLDEMKLSYDNQSVRSDPPSTGHGALDIRPLDKAYKILLDALGFDPSGIDSLVGRSGLPSQTVASMLLILELEGAVDLQPDGRYVRRFR